MKKQHAATPKKLRMGTGHDCDLSPHHVHADGYYRDGSQCCVALGGIDVLTPNQSGSFPIGPECMVTPELTPEELKAKTNKALQDLFSSYANQLRGSLQVVLSHTPNRATKDPPPPPRPFEEACRRGHCRRHK